MRAPEVEVKHPKLLTIILTLALVGLSIGQSPQVIPGVQGNLADLDLSAHRGTVVIVATLAGWCVGCFPEVPGFVELQRDYGDSGVVVLGVLTQSAPEWADTFAQKLGVTYPLYLDMSGSATVERFGSHTVPSGMLVFDRDGNLVESLSGFDATKVEPILQELL